MHPAWLRCESSEPAAPDSCTFAPTGHTKGLVMKKIALFSFLLMVLSNQPAFSQEQLDGRKLLKQLKNVNGQILETRIKLGEALIKHLKNQDSYVQSERMKSIYRLATEYQNFCDCEQRVLLMYTHTKENVKVYLSAFSRDIVQKKKRDFDETLKNISKYSADIHDPDIIIIVTNLHNRLNNAQELINKLIRFYSSENERYRQGKNKAFE
jgi:hypothetical protein